MALPRLLAIALLASCCPALGHKALPTSPASPPSCASCRSSPASCALRSGLFTRAQLPAGVNLVATLPRGACAVNVTEMAPSANHLGLRAHRDGRLLLNGWGSPDWPGEYPAAGALFSYKRGARGEALWAAGPLTEPLDIMLVVKQHNPGIQYQYQLPPAPDVATSLPPDQLMGREEVSWRVAGFTQCSLSCGGGEQQAVLACMRGAHATLPPEMCDALEQPDEVTVRCNTKPCPATWEGGDWSACSATCGHGTQLRALVCRQVISASLTVTVAEGACLGPPPERSRLCQVRPCAVLDTRWSVGDWGPCSAACGPGVRSRRVWCEGDQAVEFPDMRCSEHDRPPREEACDTGSCATNTWFFTEWTNQCSSSCGPGSLTRRVHCSGGGANAVQPDDEAHCDPRARPDQERPCHGDKGCGGAWFHGPWEQCSERCDADGEAQQSRSVACVQFSRGQFRVVLEARCSAHERPAERRKCPQQPPACRPQWFFSDWTQCEGPCGGSGQRSREVRCLDPGHAPSMGCPEEERPVGTEKCEPEHCTSPRRPAKGTFHGPAPSSMTSCAGDKLRNCALVVQARLCQSPYYRRACCGACAKKFE